MTRKEILENAMRCVNGDRDEQYGKPENSFLTIARFWTAYLNAAGVNDGVSIVIKGHDVAAMLALMKIARISSGVFKADNWIDLAGYAACGGECESPVEEIASKCENCEFRSNLPYHYPDLIYGCTLRQCVKKQPNQT